MPLELASMMSVAPMISRASCEVFALLAEVLASYTALPPAMMVILS